MVAAVALCAALAPHVAAAATTVTLFPAHNTFNGQAGTFDTKSVVMFCRFNDLTIIDSPGNPTGLIVDNFLTETAKRFNGTTVLGTQNLCLNGNGAAPQGNSCFSSANQSAFTPGTPANSAYQGIGTVTAPTVPGLALYTFQLVNAPGAGTNPQASNALRLRTSCRVLGGDAQRGRAATEK
jgi:hypothetical protein